jgi:POT family proton-dependent oligopeptide transporter
MGINIGAFTATLLCGWLGEVYGWSWGFGAAGIGMLFGLVFFQWGQKFLAGHGEPTEPARLKQNLGLPGLTIEGAIYLGSFIMVAIVWQLVQLTDTVGCATRRDFARRTSRTCVVSDYALRQG